MHQRRIAMPASLLCLTGLLIASIGIGCKPPPVVNGPAGMASELSFYKAHQRQREYWPTQAWKKREPAALGLKTAAIKAAAAYAFTRTGNDKDRKGIRTDGMVVIKNGYLVYEQYARGFKADTPHLAWSVSKSFVNALYGIATRMGKCKIGEPASKYYKGLNKTKLHKAITIKQLLHMTPGLHWFEGYEAGILNSSVLAMLYAKGRHDMASFTAGFRMAYNPGTHFYYSSGTTNLAVGVLREIMKGQKLEDFMWKELFDAIGMKRVTWQRDGVGNVVGSSYLYAPPRQLAKFGYLYLNDGVWNGKRILPKGWVKFTATTPKADAKGVYGAHWWLNTGRPAKGIARVVPAAPSDMFMASGHWGQRIIVIPSQDMVVVLTADNRDKTFKLPKFMKLLMGAVMQRQFQVRNPAPSKAPKAVKASTTDNGTTKIPTKANAPTQRPGGR